MANRKYFGTDGIRGPVGRFPITAEFVLRLGWAVGRVLCGENGGKVVIGKDTRISGYMFESVLEAGLASAGVDSYLLGPMPTPAIAYLTRTMRADAGIVISASHNPYQDNGIKFFSAEGTKLPDEVEHEIESMLDRELSTTSADKLGKAHRVSDAAGRYIEFCKATVPGKLNLSGFKIVLDCAHGATYHIAPNVFAELGAEVVSIGASPDGLNINDGYGATDVANLSKQVVEHEADLGIAFDGDGDRVIMVDHEGVPVDGDELLYIIAMDWHAKGRLQGGVVGTQMSNLGLEKSLASQNIEFTRSKVGDRYVIEQLLTHNWLLGGEGSGHIICLNTSTTGDGIIAALQVMVAVVQKQRSLRELLSGMQKLPQVLINVKVDPKSEPLGKAAVVETLAAVESELGESGRVLLRASGTEPLIRVMLEGTDEKTITPLAERLADSIRNC